MSGLTYYLARVLTTLRERGNSVRTCADLGLHRPSIAVATRRAELILGVTLFNRTSQSPDWTVIADETTASAWQTISDALQLWEAKLGSVSILSLSDLRALPKYTDREGGVYFLWRSDRLVYVGRSRNLGIRIQSHVERKVYSGLVEHRRRASMNFDDFTCLVLDDGPEISDVADEMLALYEHAYIRFYKPEYNTHGRI
jgi:hypothetical protein